MLTESWWLGRASVFGTCYRGWHRERVMSSTSTLKMNGRSLANGTSLSRLERAACTVVHRVHLCCSRLKACRVRNSTPRQMHTELWRPRSNLRTTAGQPRACASWSPALGPSSRRRRLPSARVSQASPLRRGRGMRAGGHALSMQGGGAQSKKSSEPLGMSWIASR